MNFNADTKTTSPVIVTTGEHEGKAGTYVGPGDDGLYLVRLDDNVNGESVAFAADDLDVLGYN